MAVKNLTSSAELQEYWLENIAPNYFDMDDTNNYRAGIFGYINEVMSTSLIDVFYTINVARREFYPNTAKFMQSFYKMAALQQVSAPLVTAATAKAILVIPQKDIISNSTTTEDGVYKCVIDKTAVISAEEIPFMLDYSIIILSKRKNGKWSHTIHYDTSYENELVSSTSSKYIANKIVNNNGADYILMSANVRQVQMSSLTETISKDTTIDTTTLTFTFDGDLSHFDVFYIEEPEESDEIQLKKILYGGTMSESPFCYYKLVDSATIQIIFPNNPYFTPKINSEIRVDIYTSLGSDGEFKVFNGNLACEMKSEKYPYNANITMTGVIDGASSGAKAKPTTEEFRQSILRAYTTNNTITSEIDLQKYFDSQFKSDKSKVIFRKKRDDDYARVYGAYFLLKDENELVIPTNSLTINLNVSDLDTYNEESQRAVIRPGTIFSYEDDISGKTNYNLTVMDDVSLSTDLSEFDDNSRFLFTNPFLIGISLDQCVVGFYYNSVNESRKLEYSYVNDSSMMQFIGSNLTIKRNAMNGEDFYQFEITISPSSDLDIESIVEIPDNTLEENLIRAQMNGYVDSIIFSEGRIQCTVIYEDETEEVILLSNGIEAGEDEYDYLYDPGYTMRYNVYESFVAGDIIAEKKCTDLGKIRAALNFKGMLYESKMYIPMSIEEADKDTNFFVLRGYISTDDSIELDGTMTIENGVYMSTDEENDYLSISMNNLIPEVSIFYKNDDVNPTHIYSEFNYFKNYTLTNTYSVNVNEGIDLIKSIDFIRSVITYTSAKDDDFSFSLSEVPVLKANWAKNSENFNYFTSYIYSYYEYLYETYFLLENNYGIDMKFYNTYGKSRFYKIGIRDEFTILKNVNNSISFGICLSPLTAQDIFLISFRKFVKDYIEQINDDDGSKEIYMMNMVSEIKSEFSEIEYIEYYGFDNYTNSAQKIEPLEDSELTDVDLLNYIPEFINIYTERVNGENIPKIDVLFLDN